MEGALRDRDRTEQAEGEVGPAGADHAGQRDDLSGMQFDGNIPDPVTDGNGVGPQHGLIGPCCGRAWRKQIAEIAADHHGNQPLARDVGGILCADETTVLQDGRAIAQRENFIEAV